MEFQIGGCVLRKILAKIFGKKTVIVESPKFSIDDEVNTKIKNEVEIATQELVAQKENICKIEDYKILVPEFCNIDGKYLYYSSKDQCFYIIDLTKKTCSCCEFQGWRDRTQYDASDIRRYCRHMIKALPNEVLENLDELRKLLINPYNGTCDVDGYFKLFKIDGNEIIARFNGSTNWVDVFARRQRLKDGKENTGPLEKYGFNVEENRWSYGNGPRNALAIKRAIKICHNPVQRLSQMESGKRLSLSLEILYEFNEYKIIDTNDDDVRKFIERSIEVESDLDKKVKIAELLINIRGINQLLVAKQFREIGEQYQSKGDIEKARENYLHALNLDENVGVKKLLISLESGGGPRASVELAPDVKLLPILKEDVNIKSLWDAYFKIAKEYLLRIAEKIDIDQKTHPIERSITELIRGCVVVEIEYKGNQQSHFDNVVMVSENEELVKLRELENGGLFSIKKNLIIGISPMSYLVKDYERALVKYELSQRTSSIIKRIGFYNTLAKYQEVDEAEFVSLDDSVLKIKKAKTRKTLNVELQKIKFVRFLEGETVSQCTQIARHYKILKQVEAKKPPKWYSHKKGHTFWGYEYANIIQYSYRPLTVPSTNNADLLFLKYVVGRVLDDGTVSDNTMASVLRILGETMCVQNEKNEAIKYLQCAYQLNPKVGIAKLLKSLITDEP